MDNLAKFVERIRLNNGFTTSIVEGNKVVKVTYRGQVGSGARSLIRRVSLFEIESFQMGPEDHADFVANSMRDQV